MNAQPGDWLIVEQGGSDHEPRRALIEEVTANGEPPYRVRWLDTGFVAFVIPGADARIETRQERADAGARTEIRAAEAQRLIRSTRGRP